MLYCANESRRYCNPNQASHRLPNQQAPVANRPYQNPAMTPATSRQGLQQNFDSAFNELDSRLR